MSDSPVIRFSSNLNQWVHVSNTTIGCWKLSITNDNKNKTITVPHGCVTICYQLLRQMYELRHQNICLNMFYLNNQIRKNTKCGYHYNCCTHKEVFTSLSTFNASLDVVIVDMFLQALVWVLIAVARWVDWQIITSPADSVWHGFWERTDTPANAVKLSIAVVKKVYRRVCIFVVLLDCEMIWKSQIHNAWIDPINKPKPDFFVQNIISQYTKVHFCLVSFIETQTLITSINNWPYVTYIQNKYN